MGLGGERQGPICAEAGTGHVHGGGVETIGGSELALSGRWRGMEILRIF